MSVTLRHDGLPYGVCRRDVEQLAIYLGRELFSFSETTIQLLLHYIAKTAETDFLPGRICGMWEQPSTTANKFGISTRALSYKERELEEAGLIIRTGTAHAARTGKRHDDRITYLAGINLAPLIERYGELTTMLAEERLRQDCGPYLRLQISQKRAAIRASGEAELVATADKVSGFGRTRRITDIERLEKIDAALDAILVQLGLPSGAKFTSDRSEAGFALYKPSESTSKHHTGSAKANNAREQLGAITPAAAIRLASAGFRSTLDHIGGPSWPNLIEASYRTCVGLEITPWVWKHACSKLGRERTALCVLAIDRNHRLPPDHPFYCERPSGALYMMMRKGSDQLNLNRLLDAIRGYPDGLGENVVPIAQGTRREDPQDAKSVASRIPDIIRTIQTKAAEREEC